MKIFLWLVCLKIIIFSFFQGITLYIPYFAVSSLEILVEVSLLKYARQNPKYNQVTGTKNAVYYYVHSIETKSRVNIGQIELFVGMELKMILSVHKASYG